MLSMFQKKNKKVLSPVSGEVKNLDEVNDPVFSQKMMGDGIAVVLNDESVYAPVKGEITTIIRSEHAFGMRGEDGIEILVHVGLETVNLDVQGFRCLKKVGDKVEVGDKILDVCLDILKMKNVDLITPIVVTNSNEFEIEKKVKSCEFVNAKEAVLFTYKKI